METIEQLAKDLEGTFTTSDSTLMKFPGGGSIYNCMYHDNLRHRKVLDLLSEEKATTEEVVRTYIMRLHLVDEFERGWLTSLNYESERHLHAILVSFSERGYFMSRDLPFSGDAYYPKFCKKDPSLQPLSGNENNEHRNDYSRRDIREILAAYYFSKEKVLAFLLETEKIESFDFYDDEELKLKIDCMPVDINEDLFVEELLAYCIIKEYWGQPFCRDGYLRMSEVAEQIMKADSLTDDRRNRLKRLLRRAYRLADIAINPRSREMDEEYRKEVLRILRGKS